MSQFLLGAVEEAAAVVSAAGVDPPGGWVASIDAAIAPFVLQDLRLDAPDDLIAAHFAFMNAQVDDVTAMIFLRAMGILFAASPFEMKPAFIRARKNQFMTRIVLNRRLASRYFHEGRRRVDDAATASSGAWLLSECINATLDIVDRDERATPQVRRMMHSQIATASAHLARLQLRDDPSRVERLRTGLEHSRAAERHGDTSPDHDGYAIELALRLHEATGEATFDNVGEAIARTAHVDTATLQGLQGDAHFAKAMVSRDSGTPEVVVSHLVSALTHYDQAIGLPSDPRSADVGYHLAKRGRCFALLYEGFSGEWGSRDTVSLNRALEDWLDPRSSPHRQNHEVARLLLARSRLAAARSDTLAASVDVREAARLLAGQSPPSGDGRLQSQALGVGLDEALDHADEGEAAERLMDAANLPPGEPAPSGSMTRAVMWLRGRMDRPSWQALTELVLDRVEADAAHPSLSDVARGHVTGHAATLARELYLTEASDAVGVARAVELSRAHVSSATRLSAAALDGASSAAFVYAGLSSSGREAPSEDALGHWIDAVMWGLAALQTRQLVQTTAVDRFDVAACACRVVEAALWARAATDDTSLMDAAGEALSVADDLVQDPRVARARAQVQGDPDGPRSEPRGRRATRAAGPPASTAQFLKNPSYVGWRLLADADRSSGRDAAELRQRAAAQFAQLLAHEQEALGGKQRAGQRGVTIAHDPHGLARQLVVLKRVDPKSARREFAVLSHLSEWARGRGVATAWTVPEPLGIVDIEVDTVLVMRRMPGHTLAHHAIEHLDGRWAVPPSRTLAATVSALGDFHTAMIGGPEARAEDIMLSFREAASVLIHDEGARRASLAMAPLQASRLPVAKKDPHAGNWIWSMVNGGLVMLDVEGMTARPVLVELATVLDDLPLLSLDSAGWGTRLKLANKYVEALPHAYRPDDAEVRPRLEAATLHLAVTGLARLRRRGWGTSARGIRYARLQYGHYRHLLESLAGSAESFDVRVSAAAIAESQA